MRAAEGAVHTSPTVLLGEQGLGVAHLVLGDGIGCHPLGYQGPCDFVYVATEPALLESDRIVGVRQFDVPLALLKDQPLHPAKVRVQVLSVLAAQLAKMV